MRALAAGLAGLAAGVVLTGGLAVADPSVVADVRTGVFTLFDEGADRDTPTGRQFGDDVDKLVNRTVQRELTELHQCLTMESAEGFPGNSYCPDTTP